MPHLIIGHTTDTTARVWVRGDKIHRKCGLTLRPELHSEIEPIPLSESTDYTGVFDVTGLKPDTTYEITARFPGATPDVCGRFHTFREQIADKPFSFSFVLSSCNLSVVKINNLLAFLAAAAGTSLAMSSLELQSERWRWGWLRLLRWPLKRVLRLVAGIVVFATGLKQPPPPYLRSPFPKLCAVFDAVLLRVIAEDACIPAVGDIVWSSSARGVLACSAAKIGDGSDDNPYRWELVLVHVEGTFTPGDGVFRRAPGSKDDKKTVGCVARQAKARPWHEPPSFFIHAGDQVYFDFPSQTVEPETERYQLAYRETWFDDDANQHLLSHWPHYMTWDDHEIADQFARDFKPQLPGVTPDEYLENATTAYERYVDSRNPSASENGQRGTKSRWYSFDKGLVRFFVLDTRSSRCDRDGQIIDQAQMTALREWMKVHRDDLKFVVTSVPFVAEVNEEPSENIPKWTEPGTPADQDNDPFDTWSAKRFVKQRREIIGHIFKHRIERLVFLTGDMHCSYHATMRIGTEKRFGHTYECITVHELAGGPVNQLQLASSSEFYARRKGRIPCGFVSSDGDPKNTEDVMYEVAMTQFHSQLNAVMHVKVDYLKRDDIMAPGRPVTPEVEWNVIRTLTDNGALAWTADGSPAPGRYAKDAGGDSIRIHEPVMTGRIAFARKRSASELGQW